VRVKNRPTTAQAAPASGAGLRRYLYCTAAITGAAVMIVEILGAKMLSPYLGMSHFVWTAQIAVTLVALACGYYLGGRLVDRSVNLGRLYAGILTAGLYLAVTVAVREPVAYGCLKYDLAAGSLLASTFLFFVPLCLLAMVGPFLVRVLTLSVQDVGGNVGRLTALSTLGSFVGTILIGYVLIPLLPNSTTMYLTALVLMLLAAAYFFAVRGVKDHRVTMVFLVLLFGGIGYLGVASDRWKGKDSTELFRANSNFGLLQVIQNKTNSQRFYLNDYLTQNTYDTNEQQSISMFTFMLHGLAKVYTTNIEDVLCIGMGVGIVPMDFAREGARVDVAEINPAVVPLARDYFGFQPEKLNLTLTDGRYFLNQTKKQYDAVILDAFLGDSSPAHLMTREAFVSMRRVLRPGGVLVINTFAVLEGEHDFFGASLFKTLKSVFPSVLIHSGGVYGNTLYVASQKTELKFVRQPDFSRVHPVPFAQVREAYTRLREPHPDHGRVLTDDYNPVEFYDAVNREETRKYLAKHVKEM
jgi:spermidine synthase